MQSMLQMLPEYLFLRALVGISLLLFQCLGREYMRTEESFRVVVTFSDAKDNKFNRNNFPNLTVVKQYSRRLILDLGRRFDIDVEQNFFKMNLKNVETVEIDHLITLYQADVNNIVVNDALDVTPINTTEPGIDGAYVSSETQSPLWNLADSEPYSIHAEGVWKVTNSTPNVVVAVIDTGVAELAKGQFLNLLDGYDFISDDWLAVDGDGRDSDATDPGDWADMCPVPSWHGTKVMSILASRHDNQWGMKGVAQNCSVLPIRAIGICKMGYATDVADAIVWAVGGEINGIDKNPKTAQIVSLSLAGAGSCPSYLQSAIDQALSLGAIVVASAGNNNQNVSGYFPCNCAGVIAVSASTRDGRLAYYSNWGSLITVAAPGGNSANAIMALSLNSMETDLEVSYGIGTSFATPHVAGVGALYASLLMGGDGTAYIDTKFLSLSNRSNCRIEMCGSGILSAQGMVELVKTRYYSNYTHNETFDKLKNSSSLIETAYFVPYGNTAGNILAPSDVFKFTPTGSSGPSSGQYFYQCGAGSYMCRFGIFRDSGAIRGFSFACCDMNNNQVYSSIYDSNSKGGCFGWCSDYTTYEAFTGAFIAIAMSSNGYLLSDADGLKSFGPWPSQVAVVGCDHAGSNWYVNGIYGNYGTTMNINYELCRPLFVACPVGFYSLGPSTGPVACPAGTYNSLTGQSSASACISCQTGKYSSNSGQDACATCSPCISNSQYTSAACTSTSDTQCASCTVCTAGSTYKSGGCNGISNTVCTPCSTCVAGSQYRTAICTSTSNTQCASCSICNTGYYISSACTTSANKVCSQCVAGTYSFIADTSTCTSCIAGTYNPIVGASLCMACSAGSYSLTVGASSSAACILCNTGSYSATTAATSSSTCQLCSTGTFLAVTGATSSLACTLCSAGSYSPTAGSSTCALCSPGFFTISTGNSACAQCTQGYYCPNTYTKTLCTQGYYCLPGSTAPSICSAGQFAAAGASVCSTCTAGTSYSTTNGASVCTACSTPSCLSTEYKTACTTTLDAVCKSCYSSPGPSGLPPANAAFISLSDPTCPWMCNSGYYLNTATTQCILCTTSSSGCAIGQYRPQCPDGATSNSVCIACTNAPPSSYYTGISTVDGQSNCPYACNAGYLKLSSYCCRNCNNGYYASGCSFTSTGVCQGCIN